MSETNGEHSVSKIQEMAQQALTKSDDRLMGSWSIEYRNLRAVLLGIEIDGMKWAAGSLLIRRDGHEIVAQLTIQDYGYQCTLRDTEVPNLFERLENDLDCKTVPWDRTYKEKQRDKQRIAKARGGS